VSANPAIKGWQARRTTMDKLTAAIADFNGHLAGCRHAVTATSHTACWEHNRLMAVIVKAANDLGAR
jgi:hypothetical protein